MSAVREAVLLPALFLTVTLIGGLRIGPVVRFVPPPLIAVVLGLLTLAALVRSQAVTPRALVREGRGHLENASGVVVLTTLAAASVQIFTLLIPEHGLLHVMFGTFFFVQILSTLAGSGERRSLLRSLGVLLGAAFMLRYVVLESLYASNGGTLARVLTVLLEGVSLGALQYEPSGSATGYLAFAAVLLYFVALFLLTPGPADDRTLVVRQVDAVRALRLLIVLAMTMSVGCRRGESAVPADGDHSSKLVSGQAREDALRRMRVFQGGATPVNGASLSRNPPGFPDDADVTCRFLVRKVSGATAKFYCTLDSGETVKVKYGEGNAELSAEVAATRLLAALGFSVDQMFLVRKVRCLGCPAAPFTILRCLSETGLERVCAPGGLDYRHTREFAPAVIERRIPGRVIESRGDEGWAWFELDRVDPAVGGSPRADLDALRLAAMLLAHWDNKAENQRIVCLDDGDAAAGCDRPAAVIQDLGATFGPAKLDLANWRATPIWQDAYACRVSMKQLPFAGGTFPDTQISEEGRMRLLALLEQLSEEHLTALFTASGATRFDAVSAQGRSAEGWAAAFRDKVDQIREAGPCPPAATLTRRAAK